MRAFPDDIPVDPHHALASAAPVAAIDPATSHDRSRAARFIGCTLLVTLGIAMEVKSADSSRHGVAIFFVLLLGVPCVLAAAAAYAAAMTWAVRHTRRADYRLAAAVGAGWFALLQLFVLYGEGTSLGVDDVLASLMLTLLVAGLAVTVEWLARLRLAQRMRKQAAASLSWDGGSARDA
jgi:drug/metabolite transporter (DMT)-like permease